MLTQNSSQGSSEKKNVLIVSYFFPPLNIIAAMRFGEMVSHMEEFGWRCWVVTTNSSGPLPVTISEKQVLRIGEQPRSSSYVKTDTNFAHLSWSLRMVRNVINRFNIRFRSFDSTLKWYKQVVRSADVEAAFPEIQAVIGSHGPPAALWLGRYYARQYSVPLIADFRDIAALRVDGRNRLAMLVDYVVERALLKTASVITTVSPTLCEIFKKTYRKPSFVVYNGWNRRQQQPDVQASSFEKPSEQPYLYYAGRFYGTQMKTFYLLFETLVKMPYVRLVLRSIGPAVLEEQARRKLAELGIENRVDILPPCGPEQVNFESQYSVANIVIETLDEDDIFSRGTLTGKLPQLLPCKPPILAIARRDSDIGKVLETTEKGRLCSSLEQISDFLYGIVNGRETFSGNVSKIDQFSRREQARNLCKILDQSVPVKNRLKSNLFIL